MARYLQYWNTLPSILSREVGNITLVKVSSSDNESAGSSIIGVEDKSKYMVDDLLLLENGKAYVDITYDEFKINPKFEEKVFSF